jgi:hypothetical protein
MRACVGSGGPRAWPCSLAVECLTKSVVVDTLRVPVSTFTPSFTAVCMQTRHFGDFSGRRGRRHRCLTVVGCPASLPPPPPHVQEAARQAHGVEWMWWTAASQSVRGGLFGAMGPGADAACVLHCADCADSVCENADSVCECRSNRPAPTMCSPAAGSVWPPGIRMVKATGGWVGGCACACASASVCCVRVDSVSRDSTRHVWCMCACVRACVRVCGCRRERRERASERETERRERASERETEKRASDSAREKRQTEREETDRARAREERRDAREKRERRD